MVIVATGTSYYFGGGLVAAAEAESLACFQSFVAGSLVHVVLFGISHDHDHDHDEEPKFESWAFRGGLLVGLVLVFLLPHIHL